MEDDYDNEETTGPARVVQTFADSQVAVRRHPRAIKPLAVRALACSRNGKVVVSTSLSVVKVWDRVGGVCIREYLLEDVENLGESIQDIYCICFCLNDSRVLLGNNLFKLIVVDLNAEEGGAITTLDVRSNVLSIAVSLESGLGIYGLMTGEMCIFNECDPRVVLRTIQTGKPIGCCTITADGLEAITCSSETFVKVWDVASCLRGVFAGRMKPIKAFESSKTWTWGCLMSENGNFAISCRHGISGDSVHYWNLSQSLQVPVKSLKVINPKDRFRSFAVSRDARFCLMACRNTLRIWDAVENSIFVAARFHVDISDMSLAATSSVCVCGLTDGSLHVVDLCFEYRARALLLLDKLPSEVWRRILQMICW